MKRIDRLLALAAILLASTLSWAQEADSVTLTGIVKNLHSGKPQPNCILSLRQNDTVVATALTDEGGEFALPPIPAGSYTLFVKLHGLSFYQSDMDLGRSADLNISLDTVRVMQLKTVVVTAMKHMLGSMQITSAHDKRLWGLNAGFRDANASIAFAPDAHGNLDATEDLGAKDGAPKYGPVFDPRIPWQVVSALVTGKLGSMLMTEPFFERERKAKR